MLSQRRSGPCWALKILLIICTWGHALAYRPVQHCKTLGQNGHYSACTAVTQHFNATTETYDMYVRYNWFRYRKSSKGWHAIALGQQMAGAFMLIMYGDPSTPSIPMTVDVRSADGHHPPEQVSKFESYGSRIPAVDVVTAKFAEYKGDLKIESLDEKPTHVGIAEVIIRDYQTWPGQPLNPLTNTSTGMSMIWSSNYEQDMGSDFSAGRNIDMHKFGMGFGWLYVDMLHAIVPEPMFGPIDELGGFKGVSEVKAPADPTQEELDAGDKYIAQHKSAASSDAAPSISAPVSAPTVESPPVSSEDDKESNNDDKPAAQPVDDSTKDRPFERPAYTIMGKSIRDWMWHLHGLLMTLAFLGLYPLGTYLIRSSSANAFNSHWTIQSLATVSMVIGSFIGYFQSYSISIKHQYIGIVLMLVIAGQILLGWRHHVQYVATKRKTWLSKSHIILGRIILPVGFVNIILGMLRRGYGWFTITLVLILIGLESGVLIWVMYHARKGGATPDDLRGTGGAPKGHEAEEYSKLAGEDDFSDSDGEHDEARYVKEQEKQDQAQRLRKLDRV